MTTTNVPLKYLWAGIGANICWGCFVLPAKVLQEAYYKPNEILLGRVLTSFVLLVLYIVIIKRQALLLDLKIYRQLSRKGKYRFLAIVIGSSVMLSMNWLLFLNTVETGGVKLASIIYITTPLLTALLSFFILKEKTDAYKIIGLIIAGGAIAMLGAKASSFQDMFYILISATSFGMYVVLQKKLPKISRITIFAMQLFFILLLMLPFGYKNYASSGLPHTFFFWADAIILGSVFTILPIVLNLFALIGMTASSVAILLYITPVLAFTLGQVYYHEPLSTMEAIAYCVLGMAIVIFNGNMIGAYCRRKIEKC